ncbi:MAG: lysophospholipid acyltransferase family protein [Verrucomicrobiota bacterium]
MTKFYYRFVQVSFHVHLNLFHQFKSEGIDNIPSEGGFILACNHVSYLDPPLVGGSFSREIHYLARKSLFKPPILDWLLPELNAFPIDQDRPDMSSLKKVIRLAKSGEGVLIFPEGSRSYDGEPQPAQPGIGLVLAKADVPIIPARIFGGHLAWPRDKALSLFHPVQLVIGKSFQITTPKKASKEAYQKIGDEVMAAIRAIKPISQD